MLIYIFNIIFIAALYWGINRLNIQKKWFLIVSLAYLFFVSSFRDRSMGADYKNYVDAFNSIKITGTYYMEKGYVLLNRLIAKFTDSYIGVAITVNLMLFVPLYLVLRNKVEERYWGLCVFIFAANPYLFIQTTFNAMRQCCATGIILLGVNFLWNAKHKKATRYLIYIALVILAAQFHRVSYALLAIPLINGIKWNKGFWLIALGASVLGNIVGIQSIVGIVISRLGFNEGYLDYESSILDNPIYIVFIAAVVLFLIYHYDDFSDMSDIEKHMVNLYMFSLCFLTLAVSNDMFYRVYIVFAFCAIPCLPVICNGIKTSKVSVKLKNEYSTVQRLFVLYYLCFYAGYVGLLALNGNQYYIPFRFCFG